MARTKIVCTIGPAVNSLEKILELIDAGMNVARLNFSHGTHAEHRIVIDRLKQAREKRKVPLPIMLDTKGPEIRIGQIDNGQISVEKGDKLLLIKQESRGKPKALQITPPIVLDNIFVGITILFDDGYILSKVVEKNAEGVVIEIQNNGVIKSGKGVNIPDAHLELPAMTAQDVADITFGCQQDVDIVAASFIRSADHVLEIKRLLIALGKSDILLIAKIESSEGVQNFDSIVQVADGIMVARGDLGVELPLERVPALQKMMIRKCNLAYKPVVTATQMLESMIKNPRPTRAEVSDVANAIYDSTSAVMLSGETAVGSYPIEATAMMKRIAEEAEKNFNYRRFFKKDMNSDYFDISSSVALATVKTAYTARARAIFVFTSSGFTARILSRFRPEMPILALASSQKTYHQLAFNWGVIPVDPSESKNVQAAFDTTSCFALKHEIVHYGDLVVVTAGTPFGISGTTNMMMVESIGDVIVRGLPGSGRKIHGKIAVVLSPEHCKQDNLKDKILVISRCDESYLPLLKQAQGIVMQNLTEDHDSEIYALNIAKTFDIPLLTHAEGALSFLTEGQLVTLDPKKGIVYRGSIDSDAEMIARICPSISDPN